MLTNAAKLLQSFLPTGKEPPYEPTRPHLRKLLSEPFDLKIGTTRGRTKIVKARRVIWVNNSRYPKAHSFGGEKTKK